MIVEEKDLIGQIEGFPIEIVQAMCDEQVRQGNKFDVSVFQRKPSATYKNGGFTYLMSKEGNNFWFDVINRKEFKKFFLEKNIIPSGFLKVIEFTYDEINKLFSTTKEMRGSFVYISAVDAQRIIDISWEPWKEKLAKMWSVNIVLDKAIFITKEFYEEMRKACTPIQHSLFDEIFGKDEELITIMDLKMGEALLVDKSNNIYGGMLILKGYANSVSLNTNERNTIVGVTFSNTSIIKGKKVKLKPIEYDFI